MAQPKVAIRLGTEGKDQIVRDFRDVGDAGDAAANRAARAFEKAANDIESAERRKAAAAAKLVAFSPAGASLSPERGAYPSTADFRANQQQQALYRQQAEALRAAIDPAWAAQQRFNAEMGQARTLIAAGAITLDEYCAKLRIEKGALDAVTVAHGRTGASAGAVRSGMQQLSFQVNDMATMWAMGSAPMQIFVSQAGQVGQAIGLMAGESKGFIGFLGGAWGMGLITAGTVLATLAGQYFANGEAAKKAEQAAKEFGDRQSDIANFIDATTGALKEQNRTLVLNAVLTRQAQMADNEKEISESRRQAFARAGRASLRSVRAAPGTTTSGVSFEDDADVQRAIRSAGGNVDKLAQSLAALARRRPELAGVALDVSSIGGQAIMATRENERLSKELRALGGDTSALAKADVSLIEAKAKLAGATTAADRAQAQYTIRVREARAAFDASSKTIADQEKLQTALTAAERTLNVAQDAGRTGRAAAAAARRAEAKEAREAAAAGRELLSNLIALERTYDPAAASARTYREELEKIAALTGAGKITGDQAADWRAQARARNFLPNLKDELQGDVAAENDRTVKDEARRKAAEDMIADLGEQNMLLDAQAGLIRASDATRDREIAKLRVIMDLRRRGIPIESADAEAIIATADAIEQKRQAVSEMARRWDEMRRTGENAVSRLFDITSAESWGKRVKAILIDLANEFIRLQAMKALFGSSGSGGGGGGGGLLGGIIGAISGFLGGGGGGFGGAANPAGSMSFGLNPGFAAIGHEYTPAGAMLVGENGPEIVNMPRGARVMTASDTRRSMAAGSRSVTYAPVYQIDATGADQAAVARLEAKLDSMDRNFASRTLSTVSEADDRLFLRFGNGLS